MYASASKRLVLFVGGVAIRCDAPATELGVTVMGDVPAEAAFNASPHTSRPSS